jgi:hypothetical protein
MRTRRTRWVVAPRNLARIGSVLAKSGKGKVVREDLIGSVCESSFKTYQVPNRTPRLESRRSLASTLYGKFRCGTVTPAASLYWRSKSDLKHAVTESSPAGGALGWLRRPRVTQSVYCDWPDLGLYLNCCDTYLKSKRIIWELGTLGNLELERESGEVNPPGASCNVTVPLATAPAYFLLRIVRLWNRFQSNCDLALAYLISNACCMGTGAFYLPSTSFCCI